MGHILGVLEKFYPRFPSNIKTTRSRSGEESNFNASSIVVSTTMAGSTSASFVTRTSTTLPWKLIGLARQSNPSFGAKNTKSFVHAVARIPHVISVLKDILKSQTTQLDSLATAI